MGKVNSQFSADGCNFSFVIGDKGAQNLQVGVSTQRDSTGHGCHEILPAIRVESKVTTMSRNHNPLSSIALSYPGGDGQKDAVAERNNGLLEILLGVVGGRDGGCSAE